MTRERWINIGGIAAALGGLSWLAKIAVIVATDGRVDSDGAAAVFFILGAALMAVGATAIGVLLVGCRSKVALAVAVALSPILFFVSFVILDSIAKPLATDRGAAYWADEAGILVTALAWLAIGITLLGTAHRPSGARPFVRVRDTAGSGTVMTP